MKTLLSLTLTLLALLLSCNNQSTQDMNPFQEVPSRTNFGPDHALVTTPQPCVMIATWDENHTPDVMMAAWAGQYDYRQIVVSMAKHK